jgi:hypothetical protein
MSKSRRNLNDNRNDSDSNDEATDAASPGDIRRGRSFNKPTASEQEQIDAQVQKEMH